MYAFFKIDGHPDFLNNLYCPLQATEDSQRRATNNCS